MFDRKNNTCYEAIEGNKHLQRPSDMILNTVLPLEVRLGMVGNMEIEIIVVLPLVTLTL